jgi:hypothetical protein
MVMVGAAAVIFFVTSTTTLACPWLGAWLDLEQHPLCHNSRLSHLLFPFRGCAIDHIVGCPNCNGQSGGSDNGESFETAVEQNQQQPAFNATSINAVEPPSEISAALEFDPFRNVQLDDLQSIPAIQFFDAAPPDPIAGESESFNHNSLVLGDGNDQAELFLGTELYSTPGTQNLNPFSLFCPINPSVSPVRSTTSSIVPHELKWHFTNGTFMQGLEMTRANQRARLAPLESRVPIQGILFGWHTVDPSTRGNPAWIALKEIDEKVFGTWKRKPQKIALMFVCSLIMAVRYQSSYFLVSSC